MTKRKVPYLGKKVRLISYYVINQHSKTLYIHYESINNRTSTQGLSTKHMTYLSMNPLLTSPKVYQNSTIEEYKRIRYTRARCYPLIIYV